MLAATPSPLVRTQLAPGNAMRAGINLGNPVIVQRGSDGTFLGIGPALARELARRIDVKIEFVPYDTAGKLAEAVKRRAWDVAFLAIDPERAEDIDFTSAYVHIEGTYMVPTRSTVTRVEEMDRDGVRIAVGLKTAYDLFLTRNIRHAALVHEPTSEAAIDLFFREGLDAVAGVRQPLVAAARAHPGYRVLDGSFMVIRQAAAVPKGNGEAHAFVAAFIEDAKASGFAARALKESRVEGATIAPAA